MQCPLLTSVPSWVVRKRCVNQPVFNPLTKPAHQFVRNGVSPGGNFLNWQMTTPQDNPVTDLRDGDVGQINIKHIH